MESAQNNKNFKNGHNLSVSEKFKNDLPEGEYEVAFRRWLVREINDKKLTRSEAAATFNLSGHSLLHDWVKKYSDAHAPS